jgi:hypothetical protein
MERLKKLNNKQKSQILGAAAGLVLAYALASRAIDTGSWWEYFGGFVFVLLSGNLLKRAFKK